MEYETWDQYRAREEARIRDKERKLRKLSKAVWPKVKLAETYHSK